MASGTSTPRSQSRSKRSTTNLSDLRLAPLSAKYDVSKGDAPLKSPLRTPYDPEEDAAFARQHSSYLQGKSAPTTPGILSRSSSRRHLGGGLSRRGSIYENAEKDGDEADDDSPYAYNTRAFSLNRGRTEFGSGNMPKAKSEAALGHRQRSELGANRLAGPGVPLSKRYRYGTAAGKGRTSGSATPRADDMDTWLTHTGASASALVREDKGQSWLSTHKSSTSLAPQSEDDDDDDDRYEEMAALSSTTANLHIPHFEGGSPVSQRVSRWGSRYGSRTASRKTSRITSPVGTRTPRRTDPGYFDYPVKSRLPTEEPDFVRPHEKTDDNVEDELEISQLSGENSYGLGNLADRIMHFNPFGVSEQETTDDEGTVQPVNIDETPEEAKKRIAAEQQRRREEKEKLTKKPLPAPLGDGGKECETTGWQDASWLLSVASKVILS